jgi:hypothetical protein
VSPILETLVRSRTSPSLDRSARATFEVTTWLSPSVRIVAATSCAAASFASGVEPRVTTSVSSAA